MIESVKKFFDGLGYTLKDLFVDPNKRVYAIPAVAGFLLVVAILISLIIYIRRRGKRLAEEAKQKQIKILLKASKEEERKQKRIQEQEILKAKQEEQNKPIINISPVQNVTVLHQAPEILDDAKNVADALSNVVTTLEKVNTAIEARGLIYQSPIISQLPNYEQEKQLAQLKIEKEPDHSFIQPRVTEPKSQLAQQIVTVNILPSTPKKVVENIETPTTNISLSFEDFSDDF